MRLFADDRFALQSIQILPTMYKVLYMVSFANWKIQEIWYASHRENMNAMLQKILFYFLSMMQLKSGFDNECRGGKFAILFPRSSPSDEVLWWFNYCQTQSRTISIKLKKHWFNDKFMEFHSTFSLCLGFGIETKLVDRHDCFVFLQFDKTKVYFKGKGKEPFSVNSPNYYCRFEASLDHHISAN
ncbi:hypothetical protein R3W88_029453 [Solanum pinnatisectum]|uniref:C-JID domain-containing protein n=1 Tax=Solanum pinnatisectum TaxID=50273 RepID=A0AAV9K5T8_9SOLN|nr:hypothetical protein R3W88_029453 [Solanum pinnatisectum]